MNGIGSAAPYLWYVARRRSPQVRSRCLGAVSRTSFGSSRFLKPSDPGGTTERESAGLTLFSSSSSRSGLDCVVRIYACFQPEERLNLDRLTRRFARLYLRNKNPIYPKFSSSHPILGPLWCSVKTYRFSGTIKARCHKAESNSFNCPFL